MKKIQKLLSSVGFATLILLQYEKIVQFLQQLTISNQNIQEPNFYFALKTLYKMLQKVEFQNFVLLVVLIFN